MSPSRARNVFSWIIASLLAIGFALAGIGKLSGAANPMFEAWGYPRWFALFIGVAELAGAAGLLIPRLARWACFGLLLIMLGASYTHLANGEGWQLLHPLIFGVLLGSLLWARRTDVLRTAG